MGRGNVIFRRFRDLDRESINVDLQVHTNQTDGEGTVEEVLRSARSKSLSAVAFTEHVRRDTAWFDGFVDEIRRASAGYPDLCVYAGCEAKALDTRGGFDASDAIMERSDLVLGSVHRFPDGAGGYLDFKALEQKEFARIEFELALGLLLHAPIDVYAHPGGMYQRRFGEFPRDLMRDLMEASLQREIAFEINSSYLAQPAHVEQFLELCDEVNPVVSIGSDVHQLGDMGRCRDTLLETRWFQA